jgi:Holliday junction resolvasome RuvABC endonuclease subunit
VSVKVLGVDPGTAVLGYGIVESAAGLPGRLV